MSTQSDFPGISAPLINVVRMPHSGRTVYIAEASATQQTAVFGYHDVFVDIHLPVDANRQEQRTSSRVLIDNRHGGRVNLLYLDGHVEGVRFEDNVPDPAFCSAAFVAERRKNLLGFVSPDNAVYTAE